MRPSPSPFGSLADGSPVTAYTLVNAHGLRATVSDFGATLLGLFVPDARGRFADVVLGYDTPGAYKHQAGATVGRFAGPIAAGRCVLDGAPLHLDCNGGSYHMHGGKTGFSKRLWRAEPLEEPDGPAVRFTRDSPDGEEGYPGNLAVRVTYTLTGRNELRLDYEARTDKTTLCNLTNHAYFNLGGQDSGSILDHRFQSDAVAFNEVDADIIATGSVTAVTGTPFDFSATGAVGERIDSPHPQLCLGHGYDHNFLLPREAPGRIRRAAAVTDLFSGRRMEMWTTEPGFQFYTGNAIPDGETGKRGSVYRRRQGLCLEAQRAPNWPERPGVSAAVLRPGETYRQTTLYRFSCS